MTRLEALKEAVIALSACKSDCVALLQADGEIPHVIVYAISARQSQLLEAQEVIGQWMSVIEREEKVTQEK